MSVLLRHPASVPALFSRAMDVERPTDRDASWCRLRSRAPLAAMAGWAAVMLIDVPLVRAANAIVDLALTP